MNKDPKVVAIIQARMGSTRLPGKVLKDLEGETVLARVVKRLRRARLIDEVLIAATDRPVDDAIVEECERCAVPVFRGDEDDVLERYFHAAQFCQAGIVVRITSDCPLIDAEIADKTIAAFLEARPDYASNVIVRTYPRGLDTEVMTAEALKQAHLGATESYQRTHVTPYIYQNPDMFELLSVKGGADYSNQRWTLDTPEDLAFIRAIYARLKEQGQGQGQGEEIKDRDKEQEKEKRNRDSRNDGRQHAAHEDFGWRDVLRLLDREPALLELNREIMQKALHEG
jgi:spore coat polysaccharide biosynthesis protein SpsF